MIQGIDRGGRDGNAAAGVHGDRVSRLALAADLEVDSLDQAGRVRITGALVVPETLAKKLGDAGRFGGDLNLVEHVEVVAVACTESR